MDDSRVVTITADGTPATQGSKRRNRHGAMFEANPRLAGWRANVTRCARTAVGDNWTPYTGAVAVRCAFLFTPPKRMKRNRLPITRSSGDLDKLQRAVFDAITDAAVWRDDSQIVDVNASKRYISPPDAKPGVTITIWPVEQ